MNAGRTGNSIISIVSLAVDPQSRVDSQPYTLRDTLEPFLLSKNTVEPYLLSKDTVEPFLLSKDTVEPFLLSKAISNPIFLTPPFFAVQEEPVIT